MTDYGKKQTVTDNRPEKPCIMVVDDEEAILVFMKEALENCGYNITVCADAECAIKKIKKEVYDLIIVDMKMPKISGTVFVDIVKKISPKTDIVIMTGYPSIETAVKCMKLGATDYLTKPIDLEYLNIIVEKLLYKRTLEKRAAEREYFEQISRLDGLTGLYNHRFFHELLSAEIARCDRYKYSFSLLMIDIDDFKSINDNYGHQIGDAILRTLAKVFKSFVRKTDPVVRYGGEEFAIILSQTAKEHGKVFGERIVSGVASSKFVGLPENEIITISTGLAGYPEDAHTQDTLIKKADEALYAAKKIGKNTLYLYGD